MKIGPLTIESRLTAYRILTGQLLFDQLKSEIKTIVSILWGWLQKNTPSEKQEDFVLSCGRDNSGGEYQWRFSFREGNPPTFVIEKNGTTTVIYTYPGNAKLGDVRKIHSTLDQLVKEMAKNFPELKEAVIEPLAAEGVIE